MGGTEVRLLVLKEGREGTDSEEEIQVTCYLSVKGRRKIGRQLDGCAGSNEYHRTQEETLYKVTMI